MTDITHSLLYLSGVSVSFDGFRALNGLSLDIRPGEMRAIIGPNGAGKTTMMDVITGKTRPDDGEVLFDRTVDLTKLDEAAIANLGIGRKFQKPTVFEMLNVEDNLLLALKSNRRVLPNLFWKRNTPDADRVDQILATIRLDAHRDRLAGALSHGQKQWLEIGMLIAQDPKLLLVDEPVAGMTDKETEQTGLLLQSLAEKHAIIVIEHDMAFVRQIARTVTVLHEGAVICEGPVDTVQSDPRVREIYLGRQKESHAPAR